MTSSQSWTQVSGRYIDILCGSCSDLKCQQTRSALMAVELHLLISKLLNRWTAVVLLVSMCEFYRV